MKNNEHVNWDFFWNRVEKHPKFLDFLYSVHLKKYFKILDSQGIIKPRVLELGAGTGKISYELVKKYGGEAVLIDNNNKAFSLHTRLIKSCDNIEYLKDDFFTANIEGYFDLVFSDGLLEHFSDKSAILKLHKKYLKSGGYLLIFALNNNLFTKFLELGEKKMGYSEPIPLNECIKLCEENGLKVINKIEYFFEYGVLCSVK
jgi:ubiquinone/menaquinone biosynthesis C-methylase UbiE